MNYWIISPNAKNDGKIDDFVKLIKATNRVLMGWGKQDNRGKTFSNEVQINDLILIAQGSNKNKKPYFCALVDSESNELKLEKDGTIFNGQSRLLKYFSEVDILLKDFDFNECAYGASSQPSAIYKLKPNKNLCDKKLIKILEKQIMYIKIKEDLKQKINLLEYQKQIILQGPPGTGKTRLAKQMANFIINGDIEPIIEDIKEQVKLIQFHPSYSYEDFVRGIVATTTEDGKGVKYETQNKILATMAEKAKDALGDEYYKKDTSDERKKEILKEADKYILIIDEINRANLSSVLGELIYALEYRDEAVESMYELDKNREIILPSNLYIIGTMNTADRSTGYIDYAIRRRFTFVNVLPDKDVVNSNSKFNEVQKLFKKEDDIKADTLSIEFNPDDVMLGHSYFIADSDEELENKFKYQVIPLLKEYIKDGVLNETANNKIKEL